MRADKRFTRIHTSKVILMRQAKIDGYSLREIGETLEVAKSTISLYCRDLYWYPTRVYETEQEARDAITMRGVGTDHSKYHYCSQCGRKVRNEHQRCLKCNLSYQLEEGERARWIIGGIPHRFIKGNSSHKRGDTTHNE